MFLLPLPLLLLLSSSLFFLLLLFFFFFFFFFLVFVFLVHLLLLRLLLCMRSVNALRIVVLQGGIMEGGYPKKKKDLVAEIGLETDEDVHIDIKEYTAD